MNLFLDQDLLLSRRHISEKNRIFLCPYQVLKGPLKASTDYIQHVGFGLKLLCQICRNVESMPGVLDSYQLRAILQSASKNTAFLVLYNSRNNDGHSLIKGCGPMKYQGFFSKKNLIFNVTFLLLNMFTSQMSLLSWPIFQLTSFYQ